MKNTALSLVTIGTLVSLMACGKHDDKKAPAPNAPPAASIPLGLVSSSDNELLLGSWTSACKPCGQNFCQTKVEVRSDLLIWNQDQYTNSACTMEQMHVRFIGSYSVKDGKLISQLAETHMKLELETFRQAAEQSQSCGFDSWPLKSWLNITGRNCPATPEKGGVWTSLTVPGQTIVRAPYALVDDQLTFKFSDGDFTLSKVRP